MKVDEFIKDVYDCFKKTDFFQKRILSVSMSENHYNELCKDLFGKYTYYGEGIRCLADYGNSFKMTFSFGQVEVIKKDMPDNGFDYLGE